MGICSIPNLGKIIEYGEEFGSGYSVCYSSGLLLRQQERKMAESDDMFNKDSAIWKSQIYVITGTKGQGKTFFLKALEEYIGAKNNKSDTIDFHSNKFSGERFFSDIAQDLKNGDHNSCQKKARNYLFELVLESLSKDFNIDESLPDKIYEQLRQTFFYHIGEAQIFIDAIDEMLNENESYFKDATNLNKCIASIILGFYDALEEMNKDQRHVVLFVRTELHKYVTRSLESGAIGKKQGSGQVQKIENYTFDLEKIKVGTSANDEYEFQNTKDRISDLLKKYYRACGTENIDCVHKECKFCVAHKKEAEDKLSEFSEALNEKTDSNLRTIAYILKNFHNSDCSDYNASLTRLFKNMDILYSNEGKLPYIKFQLDMLQFCFEKKPLKFDRLIKAIDNVLYFYLKRGITSQLASEWLECFTEYNSLVEALDLSFDNKLNKEERKINSQIILDYLQDARILLQMEDTKAISQNIDKKSENSLLINQTLCSIYKTRGELIL